MEKPFAITLDVGSSRANKTGSWRTERAVYTNRMPPCNHACPAGEDIQGWLYEAEVGHRGAQPVGPALHRFDEVDVEVRACDRQGDPRQSRSGTDVDEARRGGERLLDDGAVEHVPLPQAGHLTRPDQPVAHPGVRQDCHELLGQRRPLPEHHSRTRGCGWGKRSGGVGTVGAHRFT